MTGDIPLGRLMGIPFRLHWSWFLAVFLIAWTLAAGFFPQTLPEDEAERSVYWGLGVLAALGLFVSVLLHELGHAFVARRFGVPVRGIRLFVFGGVAELGGEPKKPGQEILIALGGPAVSVLLIILYSVGLSLVLAGGAVRWEVSEGFLRFRGGTRLAVEGAGLLYYLGLVNTIVLLFNLVPAFPLDGGRVLRGIVWAATGDYLWSTRIAGGIGIAFAWLLFVAGLLTFFGGNVLGGVWLFFLGTFLQSAAQSSVAYAQFQQLLGGVRVAEVMRRQPITIEAHLPLREVVEHFFLRHPHKVYPVIRDGRFVGVLTLRALQATPRDQWEIVQAGDLAARRGQVPIVHPQEPAVQALRKLAESNQSRLPVVEAGSLVGLLCGRDVMALMELRSGLLPPHSEPGVQTEPLQERPVPTAAQDSGARAAAGR